MLWGENRVEFTLEKNVDILRLPNFTIKLLIVGVIYFCFVFSFSLFSQTCSSNGEECLLLSVSNNCKKNNYESLIINNFNVVRVILFINHYY